jgi:uncharacterized protein YdhG (YjbR/CyaY superfamily)
MAATVTEYIQSFPAETRQRLQAIRDVVLQEIPEAEEVIKYDMPMYVYKGNLVGFAAWKKHIGLYPVTPAMEASLPELTTYPTSGKGTVQFLHTKPLPLDLIRKIVQYRRGELTS